MFALHTEESVSCVQKKMLFFPGDEAAVSKESGDLFINWGLKMVCFIPVCKFR